MKPYAPKNIKWFDEAGWRQRALDAAQLRVTCGALRPGQVEAWVEAEVARVREEQGGARTERLLVERKERERVERKKVKEMKEQNSWYGWSEARKKAHLRACEKREELAAAAARRQPLIDSACAAISGGAVDAEILDYLNGWSTDARRATLRRLAAKLNKLLTGKVRDRIVSVPSKVEWLQPEPVDLALRERAQALLP